MRKWGFLSVQKKKKKKNQEPVAGHGANYNLNRVAIA